MDFTANTSYGIDLRSEKLRILHENDLLVLNLVSMSWNRIQMHSYNRDPLNLHLHGHTAHVNPLNPEEIFIFGGKKALTSSRVLLSTESSKEVKVRTKQNKIIITMIALFYCVIFYRTVYDV